MPREHIDYVCPGNHDGVCMFCDGGLFACTVCNSFEGATTTECPGREMTNEEMDKVYTGLLDFVDDEWKPQASTHCPLGTRQQ